MAPMDLISMLGNLLDNAIRAAAETQGEKYIKSYIYMKEVGGFCVIKITNPFENINIRRMETLPLQKKMMACMESDFIPCGGLQKNMVDV